MSDSYLKIDSTSPLLSKLEAEMAIQAQAHAGFLFNGGDASEFSLFNNNGGIGIDQSQKDFNQQALFRYPQHQQYRSQSFLETHMEKQMRETDLFIKLQNERLIYVLQEQKKLEMDMILRKLEGRALILMTQKEEEMTKALRKNMELEDLLRKMEMENQTWQRMAHEKEVMIATLNSTLAEARERAATCHETVTVEDEASFCNFPAKKVSCCCWNCGSNGVTRVLFLPCRHLCCCIDCEDGLVHCPICNTPKKSRIEAFNF